LRLCASFLFRPRHAMHRHRCVDNGLRYLAFVRRCSPQAYFLQRRGEEKKGSRRDAKAQRREEENMENGMKTMMVLRINLNRQEFAATDCRRSHRLVYATARTAIDALSARLVRIH
jgi:hypothetical protein